jgi:hypothetical protein
VSLMVPALKRSAEAARLRLGCGIHPGTAILLLCAACSSGSHKPKPQPVETNAPAWYPYESQEEWQTNRAEIFGNGSIAEIGPDL